MSHTSGSLGRCLTIVLVTTGALAASAQTTRANVVVAKDVPLSSCYSSDNGSPVITDLSVNRRYLHVTHRARTLRVLVEAHDTGGPGARAGLAGGYVQIADIEEDAARRPLVKTRPGHWRATFHFPAHSPSEPWRIRVLVRDRVGNASRMISTQLSQRGFPSVVHVVATPPFVKASLERLTFPRRLVDTRRNAVTVPVLARLTSSTRAATVHLVADERHGDHQGDATLRPVPHRPGVFRGRLVMPRWQTDGAWRLSAYADSPIPPAVRWIFSHAYLRSHGMRGQFRVVSGTDRRAPEAMTFTAEPESVDVQEAMSTVSSTVRLADGKSGVTKAVLELRGGPFLTTTPLRRVKGTAQRGVWRGTATITPCRSFPGTWEARLSIRDAAGNWRMYESADLADLGGQSSIEVLAGDHVVGGASAEKLSTGVAVVTFSEDVVGISTDSVDLYRGPRFTRVVHSDRPPVPGSWTCLDAAAATVDCLTGPVRTATFTPSTDARFNTVELNPEHELAVRDLAGNPYDHYRAAAR